MTHADDADLSGSIDIDPVWRPCDLVDVATIVAGILSVFVLVGFALAGLEYFPLPLLRASMPGHALALDLCAMVLLVFGVPVILLAKGGVGLTLEAGGVFVRTAWNGRRRHFASWSEVTRVRAVSRGKMLFVSALRPWKLLGGWSTRDAHAIEAGRRWVVIAPRDVDLLRRAVRQWWPGAAQASFAAPFLPPREETGNPYQAPKSDLVDPEDSS
jgi:hypothetical protein